MTTELSKQYEPKQAQERWLKFWSEHGFSHSRPDASREPFCIVIPPPNVTGALHMGHALNNTLQDVLIRWRRMQGFNALYMPGTDHAGIATQAVVERRLREEEKKTRHELGREELVRRIWVWKDQYESRILKQLRELGCSCDWERTRFTLDPICARAVRHTFFAMFQDGLIYRGKRLVNWDAFLQTAVADDEVENVKQKGKFFYFRYPVLSGPAGAPDSVLIGTTRPETMLGDTAVAVHPEPAKELDKREKELQAELAKASEKEGKELQRELDSLRQRRQEMLPLLEQLAAMAQAGAMLELPLVGRKIPLIADTYADPQKGTGAVKITPAHDHNDYAVWQRHPEIGGPINILQQDGKINENGQGEFREQKYSYTGMDRTEARTRVVEDLQALGLFDREEDVENTIPISDRSKTPIEPYLSDQWFVFMGDREGKAGLAQMCMDVVTDGQIQFFPERYAKTYLDWLGEKRDWCISRQLWWGHRIPIWYTECPEAELKRAFANRTDVCWRFDEGNGRWLVCSLEEDLPRDKISPKYPLEQDPDVLDTWFSSQLWPHSTLGWPGPALPGQEPGAANPDWQQMRYYYPTSVLVTSRDIITLWVARMVMAGLYNVDQIPFRHVYIHTKMLDGFGEGMSKSKGNGIDPLDIIDRYGTDALRFGIVNIATETQDSRMPVFNVCPHCDALIPVKKEHMYMQTKKVTCPECKKAFRPGGPWPSEDKELPTAKQASERFEEGRNFANKIWNAARFLLMNLEGYTPEAVRHEALPIEDRWILSRLKTTVQEATEALEGYHFSEVGRILYNFIWSEFCDWYVEMSKGRLRDEASRPLVQRVLAGVLDTILRLMHPIMPFVTESIWQALNEAAFERGLPQPDPSAESVMVAAWPQLPPEWRDPAMEQRFGRMQELVRTVRDVRNRYTVDAKTPLHIFVRCGPDIAADFMALKPFLTLLASVGDMQAGPDATKPAQSASHVQPDFETFISLEGLIDTGKEIQRLEKQLADKRKHLQTTEGKLNNENFVKKAPAEVVQEQRAMVEDLKKQIQSLETNLAELKQS
jgi:valyl-tRNA synthetase